MNYSVMNNDSLFFNPCLGRVPCNILIFAFADDDKGSVGKTSRPPCSACPFLGVSPSDDTTPHNLEGFLLRHATSTYMYLILALGDDHKESVASLFCLSLFLDVWPSNDTTHPGKDFMKTCPCNVSYLSLR